MTFALLAVAAATAYLAINQRSLTMAIRQSTLDIIAKIEALKLDADDGITQATVDAAVAERDALIAADAAEDVENADAINAALDASPVTPNAADV